MTFQTASFEQMTNEVLAAAKDAGDLPVVNACRRLLSTTMGNGYLPRTMAADIALVRQFYGA